MELVSVVKRKFDGNSFLVASRGILVDTPEYEYVARVGRLPRSAFHELIPDWSAGGLLRCLVLHVCPCVVSFSKFHEHDTHDLLRTSR